MFAAAPTISRKPRRKQRRCLDRRSDYRFVRAVRGNTGLWVWQARAWLPEPVGSVHLGCYREERAAWDAVRLWLRAGGHPCKGLPPGVLPKWVARETDDGVPTGRYLAVRRTRSGRRLVLGSFATPEQAHEAARDHRVKRWFQLNIFGEYDDPASKRRRQAVAKESTRPAWVQLTLFD